MPDEPTTFRLRGQTDEAVDFSLATANNLDALTIADIEINRDEVDNDYFGKS